MGKSRERLRRWLAKAREKVANSRKMGGVLGRWVAKTREMGD